MSHSGIFAHGHTRRIRVRGRSLTDLHDSHGPFNVLLIDVEGSELEVLRSFFGSPFEISARHY